MAIKTKFFRCVTLLETEKQMNEFMDTTDVREIYSIEPIQGYQDVVIMIVYREGQRDNVRGENLAKHLKG